MKIKCLVKLLLVCTFLFAAMSANAATPDVVVEHNPNPPKFHLAPWWINAGLGLGVGSGHHSFGGFTETFSGNYQLFPHQLITVRYMQTDQFLGSSSFTDAGVLYGLIAKAKYAYASASLGVGWARYDRWRGGLFVVPTHKATYNTVGIPGEIQLFLTPIPYVGVGLIIFGDLNNKKSVGGAAVALQFGKLRE